jgi:hypothetical protein
MLAPIAELLAEAPPAEVHWILDRPVSNSDHVGQMLEEFARERGLPWSYRLDHNPDLFLMQRGGLVVSSDALILDGDVRWVDLLSPLVERTAGAWRVEL